LKAFKNADPIVKAAIITAVCGIAGGIAVATISGFFIYISRPPSPTPTATPFVVSTPTPTLGTSPSPIVTPSPSPWNPGGTLALNDPLKDNSMGYGWDENTNRCVFKGGAYHVTAVQPIGYECNTDSPNTDFSDFAYQVTMRIIQGSEGGICFRFSISNQSGDCFIVNQNGHYALEIIHDDNKQMVTSGQSKYLLTGLGKTNKIAVRAQ
jgi:hypothetical protein